MSKEDFHGDISRNEVEIDLNKFMELLQENTALKDRIRDLEFNTSTNPWMKWIHFAALIDAWRVIPRAFISLYMWLLYYSSMWFMSLSDPTMEQSGLISIVVGAGAAWFGLYVNSGGGKASGRVLNHKEK